MFEDAIGRSLVYSKVDEDWTRKRKTCVHGFYKERLDKILEVLKYKLGDLIEEWNEEIDDNLEGFTIINIGTVFRNLYTRCIVEIGLGEDISHIDVEISYSENG